MSLNGNNLGGLQHHHRNKRVKNENQSSQKDDLGDYQGDEQQQLHGRPSNRICRDFVRGLCRRTYCRVSENRYFFLCGTIVT